MSDLNINNITDRTGNAGPIIAGVSTVTSTGAFTVPVGPTEMRGGRGRGVIGGNDNTMEYITIATTGNATDFGDLTETERLRPSACASSTRGIFAHGRDHPLYFATADYVTISSKGGASEWGDMMRGKWSGAAASNATRGLFMGGYFPGTSGGEGSEVRNMKKIEFIEIASQGSAGDFGEIIANGNRSAGGVASPTRAVFMGGRYTDGVGPSWSVVTNTMEYATIATKGNTLLFGDLVVDANPGYAEPTGVSNATRGLCAGGILHPGGRLNTIQYITIATLGNATDFGDLTVERGLLAGMASSTRGVFAGGSQPGTMNTIDYVTISSTGNAVDFGDKTVGASGVYGCSDSHGGLG